MKTYRLLRNNVVRAEDVSSRVAISCETAFRWRALCMKKIISWLEERCQQGYDCDLNMVDYPLSFITNERAEIKQDSLGNDNLVIRCSSPAGPIAMMVKKTSWVWTTTRKAGANDGWSLRGRNRSSVKHLG